MSGLMNKLKSWVTGDPFEEELYGMDDDFDSSYHTPRHEMETMHPEVKKPKSSLKVVDHPNSHTAQVVVIEPKAFEESLEMIEHLRGKKSVILNLHLLDTAQSQRIVDFLSGATHAIDGHQQRIGDNVFIFTPSNVMVTSDQAKGISMADAFWNH